MGKNISLIILFLSLLIACEKERYANLEIVAGTFNPWCADNDSLLISKETTIYYVINWCTDFDSSLTEATDKEDWKELENLFDWNTFKKVNLSTCNICWDGQDNFIRVSLDSESHYIRFGDGNESDLEALKEFADKLEEMKTAYWTAFHGFGAPLK